MSQVPLETYDCEKCAIMVHHTVDFTPKCRTCSLVEVSCRECVHLLDGEGDCDGECNYEFVGIEENYA